MGGQESTNNDFWNDYTLNLAETTLKRYLATERLNECLVIAFQVVSKRCKDRHYQPTVEEKLFFEKVEEHLLTPSYLKFINKQPWYNDTLSKITDFPA